MQKYQGLQEPQQEADHLYWLDWLRRADELSKRILQERGGQPLNIEAMIQAAKEELETRHDYLFQQTGKERS